MTGPVDRERYRRLLRWYPRSWRRAHGEVVLSTMLDEAERTGQRRPTAGDHRAALRHGLGTRLDIRTAFVASLVALAALASGVAGLTRLAGSGLEVARETSIVLSVGVAPAATAVAVVAVLRVRAALPDGRAVLLAVIAVVAGTLGALTVVAWSRGFADAETGRAQTGLAAAVIPLGLTGLAVSATGLALLAGTLLVRARAPRAVAVVGGGAIGLVIAPVLAYATVLAPAVVAACALVAMVVAAPRRTENADTPSATDVSAASGLRAVVIVLAGVAAVSGTVGVAWAFTGAEWSGLSADSTVAMRHGIVLLGVSMVPAVLALGAVLRGRSRAPGRHSWGPAIVAALAFVVVSADYAASDGSGDLTPGMLVAPGLLGVALGWWVAGRMPVSVGTRLVVAAAIAVVFATVIGVALTPTLVFTAPLLGIALLVIPIARMRRRQPVVATP